MPDFDATLDLVLYREIALTSEEVWRAWTEPELLMQWFTPAPWRTTECEIDLRPGGVFRTVMAGPDGESGGGASCYLEVVPTERLVWTGALLPGFRPAPVEPGEIRFTAQVDMQPADGGCRYAATARHDTAAGCEEHRAMGFEAGWGAALNQMVALMLSLRSDVS
jgi:uncharacterized protein YndB with AHSA1/START domain